MLVPFFLCVYVVGRELPRVLIAVIFRGEVAAVEHRQLLECALKRDAEKACRILKKHIDGCVDYTLASGRLNALRSAREPVAAAAMS